MREKLMVITKPCDCENQVCNTLANCYRNGDKAAGEQIVARFQGRVRAIVKRVLTPSRAMEWDDATQTALIHCLLAAKRWNGNCPFCCFLAVVVTRRCIDYSKHVDSDRLSPLPQDDVISDVSTPEDAELFRRYEDALYQLPSDYQAAWQLHLDKLTKLDIARQLGISERSVYNRLKAVRSVLAAALADYG